MMNSIEKHYTLVDAMAGADPLTPVAPAPVYTHTPLLSSASPPASLHLFSPGITPNVLIWKQVQERHIPLSRLGVCTGLFLRAHSSLPTLWDDVICSHHLRQQLQSDAC